MWIVRYGVTAARRLVIPPGGREFGVLRPRVSQAAGARTAISLSVVARPWARTFSAKSKVAALTASALGRSAGTGTSTAGFGSSGRAFTKAATASTKLSWTLATVARYSSALLVAWAM